MANLHILCISDLKITTTRTQFSTVHSVDHYVHVQPWLVGEWYVPGTHVDIFKLSTEKENRGLGTPGSRDLVPPTILTI